MPWAASRSLSGCCPSDWSDCGRAVLVPAAAIGLSFGELSDALTLAWAMALGALWMTALSLIAPNDPLPPPPRPLPPVDAGSSDAGGFCSEPQLRRPRWSAC
jgi:hypothetical protein